MPETTRLAPSPTGALHLGNARTFLVNWALARRGGWSIILRIEDLDGPRIKPGAADAIIDTLAWLGLDWDRGPYIQSTGLTPYRDAMHALRARGLTYPSELSRSRIKAAAEALSAPQEGSHEVPFPASLRPAWFHPGEPVPADHSAAVPWRFATPPGQVRFTDQFAGPQSFDPSLTIGDFIIWTAHEQPAYQLAVVVDDHRQGVTQVVRGDDLLDSAARQLLLYRALGLAPEPAYTHLPLVRGIDGKRLAKRHGDTRIDAYRARGVSATRVIGLLAAWSGILPRHRPADLSAPEFMAALDLRKMSTEPTVFTPEDDAWLTGNP